MLTSDYRKRHSLEIRTLEESVLKYLCELDAAQLMEEPQDRQVELGERFLQLDERIGKIRERIARQADIDTLLDLLVEFDAQAQLIVAEIEKDKIKSQEREQGKQSGPCHGT